MDYSTWLTKQQVADRLKVGIRTVETLAQNGQLHQARRRQPDTGQHVAVYHPDDVERIAADRLPGPPTAFLVPDAPTNGNGNGHPPSQALARTGPPAVDPDPLRTLATALLAAWTEARKEGSQAPQASQGSQGPPTLSAEERAAQWVTLSEAAVIKGRTPTYLKRKIAEGTLKAEKDRGWRIRRKDLEAL